MSTDHSTRKWPVAGSVWLGVIGIVLLVGGFALWAATSQIAGAVIASGQIEVEHHRQIVQHPDGGVVAEILTSDGQHVDAGQVLIRLDGALLKTDLAIVEGQYFELLARRGRLEAERADEANLTFPTVLTEASAANPALNDMMAGQGSLFRARKETLSKSLEQFARQSEQIDAEISGIDAQSEALGTQRALLEKELIDQRSLLAKGLAQTSRVLSLEREAARLDGQLGEMAASRARAATRKSEIDIARLRLVAQRREDAETELREMGQRELELAERRRGLSDQITRLEIRAPVSGLVHQMQITTPRSVIRAAEPILYIIPQDRPLVIAARIAPIHIDEVTLGQPVRLRFAAFSARNTPEIDGQVTRISADALIDEATRAAYYRAEIAISPGETDRLAGLALLPGMPVEVFIQTGERSPLAYLVKPLADYFTRAFRES